LAVLVATLVLTGCEGASYGTPANPLRFGYVPHERTQIILFRADDVTELIESQSGLVVEPFATMDYLGLVEAMCNREAEVSVLAASAYVLAAERGCAEAALVSLQAGEPFHQEQLVFRTDSGIEGVGDLAGKTFCRPDVELNSGSGWIAPFLEMRAVGIDPTADLGQIVDVPTDRDVVKAVYDGDCEAGSTIIDARDQLVEEIPTAREDMTVIVASGKIPNDVIAFAPHLDAETRAVSTQAMLAVASNADNADLLNAVYRWNLLAEADDALFDDFRQQLEMADVDIKDLRR
jgi:phosphonate transport system substrate-binding protein